MSTNFVSAQSRGVNGPNLKFGEHPSILDYLTEADALAVRRSLYSGPSLEGIFQAALSSVAAKGGGKLFIPNGTYPLLDFDLPSSVHLVGEGIGTLLQRAGTITPGRGIINISSNDWAIENLLIDGGVTTSVGLLYNSGFSTGMSANDPMAPSLTDNSSIWITNGSRGRIKNVQIQHTGGYAILLDARVNNITDIEISDNTFINNRPHLFGISSGDLNYGSWTGGVHYQNDASTSGATTRVSRLLARGNKFIRNCGNCFWGHGYGFYSLHESIQVENNYFLDTGLDGIETANVIGGNVSGNHFRRSGYICTDDTSPSVPKWLPNLYAVCVDTSGVVKDVDYKGNTFTSVNGMCMSLDGYCYGTCSGNSGRIPISTDIEYGPDSIAVFGPGGVGSNWSQGIIIGNTAGQEGGQGVDISHNNFTNFGGCNIGLYAAQNSQARGNILNVPIAPNQPPMALGNIGTASNQRSYNNVVDGNTLYYSPVTPQPCVFEDSTGGTFLSTDKNWVFNNKIIGNGNAYEMGKDPNTTSTVQVTISTNHSAPAAASAHSITREGKAADYSSAMKWYLIEGTSQWQHMQLQGYWSSAGTRGPLLNVSEGGTGGVLATGARTSSVFSDAVVTGKGYLDGFLCLTDTTYLTVETNLLNQVVGGGVTGVAATGLVRYHGSVGYFEQSVTISSGARVWIPFSSSLWANSPSTPTDIYNLNYATGNVLVGTQTDDGSTAFLQVAQFVSALTGYYSVGSSYQTVKIPNGGFYGSSINLTEYLAMASVTGLPPLTSGDNWSAGTGVLHFDASSGVQYWYLSYGTGTHAIADAYLHSAGVVATSTSYQSIQNQSGGGFYGSSINLTEYLAMASVTGLPPLTSGDNWSAGTGVLHFDASSGVQYWYLSYGTGTHAIADAYLHSAGVVATSTSYQSIQNQSGGGFYGSSINLTEYLAMASVTGLPPLTSGDNWSAGTGVLHFDASSGFQYWYLSYGTAAHALSDAWLHAAGAIFTNSTAFNAVTIDGGAYALLGFTSDQSVYLKGYSSSSSLNAPSSGYGALAYKSTSVYWYYNGTAWASVDLSSVGGGGYWTAAGSNIYNNNTGNVGIGPNATSPASQLVVHQNQNASTYLDVMNSTSGTAATVNVRLINDSGLFAQLGMYSSTTTTYGSLVAGQAFFYTAAAGFIVAVDNASGALKFAVGSGIPEVMRIIPGAVGINNTSPGSLLTVGSSSGFAVDNSGNVTMAGTLQVTGAGVNVTAGTNYAAIQAALGGMLAIAFTATRYIQIGTNNGVPTTLTTLANGCIYYDVGSNTIQARISGAWATVATSAGVVTSLTAGTGVSVSASTGAVTVSIGQSVATSATPTFSTLTLTSTSTSSIDTSGGIDCTALYASIDAFNTISLNGGIEVQRGASTASNMLTSGVSGGTVIINNNGAFVSPGGIAVGAANIGGQNFAWWSGSSYAFASNSTVTYSVITSITVSGGIVTSISGSSDSRLKTVQSSFIYGMSALRGLQPVIYRWNDLAKREQGVPTDMDFVGFIAQDVIAKMPETGTKDSRGYLGYQQTGILASLVVAANELDDRIAKLEEALLRHA